MHAYYIHSVYSIAIWWFHHSIQSFLRYFSRIYGCHGKWLTCLNAHAISTVHGLCIKQFLTLYEFWLDSYFALGFYIFFPWKFNRRHVPGHDSLCVHTVDRVDRAILQPGVSLIKLPHITSLSMQLTHCTWNMEENVLLIRFSGGASAMLKSIAFYNDSLTLLLEPFCGYYFIFMLYPVQHLSPILLLIKSQITQLIIKIKATFHSD